MARTKAYYDVTVLELIKAGLLKPGDAITYEARKGERYNGHLEANGDLVLDGQTFDTPSGAARTLAKASRNGWDWIKINGKLLREYRDQFLSGNRRPSIEPVTNPPALGQLPSSPVRSGSLKQLILAHRDELKRGLADRMASLSAEQFEELVAEFLRRLGYSEVRRVGGPGDRNIDVTASYPAPFIEVPIRVQVKHRRTSPNVGPTDVAAFRDRAGGADHLLLMATNAEFTGGAEETASEPRRQLVHLMDGKQLIDSMLDRKIGVREGPMGVLDIDEGFWSQF